MWFFVLSLCLISTLTNFCSSSPMNEAKTLNYRLNTDVEPLDYTIDLTPYFDGSVSGKKPFTFDGICTITIKARKSNVDTITLHKEDLNILEQSLTRNVKSIPTSPSPSDGNIDIKSSEYNEITTIYTLKLAKPLVKDELYDLKFKYAGNLQTNMHGLYRSSYRKGNVTQWLASTQMEPIYARLMFPCFDEPNFKATFSIIINRPAHFKPSISNGALVSSHLTSSNLVREYFEKSPRMSTYLVAVVVSEFECRENALKSFSVCSRPMAYKETEYSFHFGQKMLAKFDELFDYKYSKHMTKMTLAAIPDFEAGAMENWGLIIYREVGLLYDPKLSSAINQQDIAVTIAHEQAHMWFGDLVTCDWWSHLWLNEGFAQYFTHFGLALVESDWGLDQQFTIERMHMIFAADSLDNSLGLSHEVKTSQDIKDTLGQMSYNKGASVIRMIQHTIGNDKFIAGLRKYFKVNALKTAVPETLYAALQSAVGNECNVTEIMDGWVYQPGFPVLHVKLADDRKRISITQKRFLQSDPNHNDKILWNIPLTYATNKENNDFSFTKPVAIMSEKSMQVDLKEPADWIVLNVQQSGYYRVNYDDNAWSALANILHKSHSAIHILNRAQIIDDAMNLARYSYLSYKNALTVVQYLENEIDYAPWKAAFSNFDFILARFKSNEVSLFEDFGLRLLDKACNHLGFRPKADDTRLDIYNRNNILKYACQFGQKQCINDARAEFDNLLRGNYTIPVDLVQLVYCTALEHGADKEWDFLWSKFKSTDFAAEQIRIINILGCTKQPHLLKKYLNLILSDEIRLQDKHAALVSTLKHRQNLQLVLDFVTRKHVEIAKIFESKEEVPSILSLLLSRSTTDEEIDRIQKFAEENNLSSSDTIKTALQGAKFNLRWAEGNIPIIKDIIKHKYLHSH